MVLQDSQKKIRNMPIVSTAVLYLKHSLGSESHIVFLTQFKITTTQQTPHHFHHILLVRINHKISPDSRTRIIGSNIEGKINSYLVKRNLRVWRLESLKILFNNQSPSNFHPSSLCGRHSHPYINCTKGFSYILHSYLGLTNEWYQ